MSITSIVGAAVLFSAGIVVGIVLCDKGVVTGQDLNSACNKVLDYTKSTAPESQP